MRSAQNTHHNLKVTTQVHSSGAHASRVQRLGSSQPGIVNHEPTNLSSCYLNLVLEEVRL